MMKLFLLIVFLIFKLSDSYAYTDPILETYACVGNEVAIAVDQGKWGEYSCNGGEWFMRINEQNPFTIRLEKSREHDSDGLALYNMVPTIPVNPKTRWILKRHWFRGSFSGHFEIIPKRQE